MCVLVIAILLNKCKKSLKGTSILFISLSTLVCEEWHSAVRLPFEQFAFSVSTFFSRFLGKSERKERTIRDGKVGLKKISSSFLL